MEHENEMEKLITKHSQPTGELQESKIDGQEKQVDFNNVKILKDELYKKDNASYDLSETDDSTKHVVSHNQASNENKMCAKSNRSKLKNLKGMSTRELHIL